jgi:hypothetical protein
MKIFAAFVATLPLLGGMIFTCSKALADSFLFGTVSEIGNVTLGSSESAYYTGYIILNQNYYVWGGSWCSSYPALSPTQIQLISDAVINKKMLGVFYTTGAYYPCLTGISVTNSSVTSATSTQTSKPVLSPPSIPRR